MAELEEIEPSEDPNEAGAVPASLPTPANSNEMALPTTDSLFEAYKKVNPKADLPETDDLWAAHQSSYTDATQQHLKQTLSGSIDNNPAVDAIMQKTTAGRIQDAFGKGFASSFEGNLGLESGSDSEKWLMQHGLMNDYAKGQEGLLRTFNEAFIRPSAIALDAGWKTITGTLTGVSEGATQAAQEIGGVAPELTEWALTTGAPELMLPHPIAEGASVGAVEPEANFLGIKEPTPQQQAVRENATAQIEATKEIASEPADIHTVAREVAPETFDKYDTLSAQKENLRSQLADLATQRDADVKTSQAAELQPINDKIDEMYAKVKGREEKFTNKQAARLQDLQSQRDELLKTHQELEPTDTEEMTNLRAEMQKTDYAMRDIAPDVSSAYREAQSRLNASLPATPEPEVKAPEEAPQAEGLNEEQTKGVAQQLDNISKDVSSKLQAAGRPQQEADAAAQLVAQHYRAVSEQGWTKGTPEEIYKRDFANIVAGKEKGAKPSAEKEVAQAPKPKIEKTPDSLLQFISKRGGIKDEAGELEHIGAADWHKEKPFRGKLIKENGMNADDAALAAWEHGYFPEYTERPDINDLYDKIHQELRGQKQYPDNFISNLAEDPEHLRVAMEEMSEKDAHHLNLEISEYHESVKAEREAEERKWLESRGEAWEPEKQNTATLEDLENDRRQENLARESKTRAGANEQSGRAGKTEGTGKEGVPERGGAAEDAGELSQKARGKIRLATDNAKATITLMKTSDASTFIHETGHHWLDEMMRYAKVEDAPDALKKDAETVNKWLGVKEGEEIKRAQHEKFARGFERYLMEGTAPSKELAGVFAKFKQWLTSIYQTVKRLNSPITDDIRDVFDRLLSSKPEKTVIAPEQESAKITENIHEKQAESTPPEKAAEVGDNIRSAVNNVIKTHEPETYERLTRPQTGTGDNQAAPESTTGGGGATGAIGGTPETPQLPGAVNAGGTETPGKGGAVPPVDPNAVSGKVQSKLIDKAGNIRLENLTNNEDVREAIRQAANDTQNFANARSGVITDDEVANLANAMGVQEKELNLQKLRAISVEDGLPLAARIRAGRQMLVDSSNKLTELAANVKGGTDEDLLKLAEARQRHLMIAETVSGITEEVGRGLRAFRDISKEEFNKAEQFTDLFQKMTGLSPKELRAMAEKIGGLDTPAKVAKFIQDSTKPSFGSQILEYWINGLISGPATHTTYSIGNTLLRLWQAGPETAIASGLSKLYETLGREGSGVRLGEVGAQIKGGIKELPTAISAAGKAFETGSTTLLPGETIEGNKLTPFELRRGLGGQITNESKKWADLGADALATVRGLKDAFVATGELIKSGGVEGAPLVGLKRSAQGAIPDIQIKGVTIPVGNVIRLPARAIATLHSFFRTGNYSMEKYAYAYRTAVNEGLTDNQLSARIADIVTNPTQEMMDKFTKGATESTLMGAGGQLTQAVSKLTNASFNLPLLGETKPLKFIDPFVHIGSNIIDQAIVKRTPVGILSKSVRDDLLGKNGAEARDFAQARMLAGTSLGILGGILYNDGNLSDSGPTDPRKAAVYAQLSGTMPHSVRIGDTWYDIHRLGPLGMLLGVSADLAHAANTMSEEDSSKVASMLVHAFSQNILDESFMRGPAELIKALDDHDRYGDAYIRNMASSFVPFSVGMSQVARGIDPYSRQARTTMDAIKAKIPWESETLLPRRDVWGRPIPNKDVLGVRGLSAIYESQVNNDPVNQRLISVGMYPASPRRQILGVPLTDKQYDEYSAMAGINAKQALEAFVRDVPDTAGMPAGEQRETMKQLIKESRERASAAIRMQYPDIIQKAVQLKRDARR